MSIGNPRIVLYCEGLRESTPGNQYPPIPGEVLEDGQWGAAHWLVARLVEADHDLPRRALRFVAPMHWRGQMVRGSQLRNRKCIRRVLSWPSEQDRPDLAIVMIDADQDAWRKRQQMLRRHIEDLAIAPPTVIAVAVREFEAWLIADTKAAGTALRRAVRRSRAPEQLQPTQAKQILGDWVGGAEGFEHPGAARVAIAQNLDLETVAKCCPAFGRLRTDLRKALGN